MTSNPTATNTPALPSITTPRLSELADSNDTIGSPFKRHRASNAADLKSFIPPEDSSIAGASGFGLGIQQELKPVTSTFGSEANSATVEKTQDEVKMEDDEL